VDYARRFGATGLLAGTLFGPGLAHHIAAASLVVLGIALLAIVR
jgi:hypothetical protein